MSKVIKAASVRALWTLVEVMASSAIAAIGSATTMSEVDWKYVGSVAILAGIISILKSLAVGMPEAPKENPEE